MRAVIYTGGSLIGEELVKELKGSFREVIAYENERDIPDAVSDDPIDLLVLVGGGEDGRFMTDGEIGTPHDYDATADYLASQMKIRYTLIKKYEQALDNGRGKRLGFVTYRYASVTDNQDTACFALHMDAAAMSMLAKMCHEKYHNARMHKPNEWTVRVFAAEKDEAQRKQGMSAAQYMRLDFCQDKRYDPRHYEENHLRMRDHHFIQIPW